MTPAGWATEEVLEQRRKAYEEKVSTSHWPHKWLGKYVFGRLVFFRG